MKTAVFCLILLSACAAPYPVPSNYVAFAESAIQQKQWETAYRFLEDAVMSPNQSNGARAQQLLLQYPRILEAGKHTFSPDSIASTLSIHGESKGLALERKRLTMYRAVAEASDYELARSNVDAAAARIDDKNLRRDAANADTLQRREESRAALAEALAQSRFTCSTRDECQKAFALTQIYISDSADMKIQVATDSIVETFNATDALRVSLKAIKIPKAGASAEIVLTGACKAESDAATAELCARKLTGIYRGYASYMKSALRP